MAKTPLTEQVKLPRSVIVNKVPVSDPGYNSKDKGAVIPDLEVNYFNQDINNIRSLDPIRAIRILTRVNGTFSSAVNSYLQLAMSGYRVCGYAVGTNVFDTNATLAAQALITSLDTLYDYTTGYSDKQSLSGLVETLVKEVLQTGSCMTELVLNQYRLPEKLIAIPVTSIQWVNKPDGSKAPRQIPSGGGDYISLDLPTIHWAATAKSANTIYNRSPFESALNTMYMHQELVQDIFRVIRRTGHSRLVVKVLQEQIFKHATPDVQNDPVKLAAFFEQTRKLVEQTVTSLNPEDALVHYDTAEINNLSTSKDKVEYGAILDAVSGMLATSLKSVPSVLGMRLGGSQSLSNTESMVYLKMVEGIRQPVETVLSRALTLAVRLTSGIDSYVKFRFNPVELRPYAELSQHRSIEQSNVLNKLSLGFISDDEAAFLLGHFPRPAGAMDLSGTRFMDSNKMTVDPTNVIGANDDPQSRALGSKTSKGSSNPNPPGNNGGNNAN